MRILYITYIDFGELGSGSSVRPQKMYEAFLNAGAEVTLVSGLQNRRKERLNRVREAARKLETERPDICYIEPPTCPIYWSADRKLIKKVCRMKIPTAVFYRDAHWKFADWWGERGIKGAYLKHLHKKDLSLFKKCCDIVYFPSESMKRLFEAENFKSADVLPPACERADEPRRLTGGKMIYVGGVSRAYGTDLLIGAFERANREKNDLKLILCCRENEMNNIPGLDFNRPFLKVVHKSGKELEELFKESDCGIIPLRRDRYMDFAVPVKLFEYIGAGLPVISTDCPETAEFIKRNGCGAVCAADAESLADEVLNFYNANDKKTALYDSVYRTARENLWQSRAGKVIKDLTGRKEKQ